VATEIFDDSGRPHTLEHLVFLGSKSYPYKGVLDSLANRAGGDGTNAWTADDHTAYTISTAGSEGFLNMLPIYLEHILYPTITKEGFTTEVYHINGKGEEAGVVMSEMQGVEQQSTRVMMRQLQLELYPPESAYRSETGGMLDALRKLTVDEIRQFHSDAYKPWNVCLHVDGSIPIDHLMRILNDTVDPMILANTQIEENKIFPASWKRPFLETPSAVGPVIEQDVRKVVDFMDKDETVGEVVIAWKGTKSGDHLNEMVCRLYLELHPKSRHPHRVSPLCIGFGCLDDLSYGFRGRASE
jgi:Zn-dependent M16 (insulinase) family peptidase